MTPLKSNSDDGYFEPRLVLVVLLALLAGGTMGGLSWLAGDHPATALAIGLTTVGVSFFAFDKLVA
ncbi:hypothetical protein [Nocardiopsis tropica]|uniref:Uncharacterized protein n=1 Tax=Nocardiopsis tropica TaxID=109330 RepID=A0ABU7KWQ8_9ACTN|nr:hypothetical protein [Nocardiopsis umidischolae]MEE2053740.1 hypothetical protein [Nocardiopsis umidischolae]